MFQQPTGLSSASRGFSAAGTSSVVEEIRTGHVSTIGTSETRSGICKELRRGAVLVGRTGLEGDQQAETFHGGLDRAVLQYDASHYADWAGEFPDIAEILIPGMFGENFSTSGMNERSICIGDVVRAGGALLQVAEPRNPCFKLDLRLRQEGISKRAKQTGRTGWLYRVLETGHVEAGNPIAVVDRFLPDWPVSRLQHFMYTDIENLDAARLLAELPYLSTAVRALFSRRIEQTNTSSPRSQAKAGSESELIEAEILDVIEEARTVKTFVIGSKSPKSFPRTEAGSHINLMVPGVGRRSYSLCDLSEDGTYKIAVQLETMGRGGSRWIHSDLVAGSTVTISQPKNFFPVAKDAMRHIMIAGGIGITPFLAMIRSIERNGQEWELHYCVRHADDVVFSGELSRYPDRMHTHVSRGSMANRLDLDKLLMKPVPGTHVYCCGSPLLMEAVRKSAAHWPEADVHFESFSANSEETPRAFHVTIESTGDRIDVPAELSLLQALRSRGYQIDSQCETGTCGTCRVAYSAGVVDHRDFVLPSSERGHALITCVSRGIGDGLKLKL